MIVGEVASDDSGEFVEGVDVVEATGEDIGLLAQEADGADNNLQQDEAAPLKEAKQQAKEEQALRHKVKGKGNNTDDRATEIPKAIQDVHKATAVEQGERREKKRDKRDKRNMKMFMGLASAVAAGNGNNKWQSKAQCTTHATKSLSDDSELSGINGDDSPHTKKAKLDSEKKMPAEKQKVGAQVTGTFVCLSS